jgi:hypothetical protein
MSGLDAVEETRREFERALVADYATIEQLAHELDRGSFTPAARHAPPGPGSAAGLEALPTRR